MVFVTDEMNLMYVFMHRAILTSFYHYRAKVCHYRAIAASCCGNIIFTILIL